MSKQAFKRVRRALKLEVSRKPLDAYAWPGGYPLYYVMPDTSTGSGACVWCPDCANANIESIDLEIKEFAGKKGWRDHFIGADVNYEDAHLMCDHCGNWIDPAYLDEKELAAARAAE